MSKDEVLSYSMQTVPTDIQDFFRECKPYVMGYLEENFSLQGKAVPVKITIRITRFSLLQKRIKDIVLSVGSMAVHRKKP